MHLGQFKGKSLLVTFIYTRCPLPNFCPRITKNFAQIEQNLAADAKLYNRSHLLCISFDPEHDSPERLRAYAAGYVPGGKPDYSHWSFAAPAKNALDEIARFFNLGMTPEADSTITHTLSTTLIGPDGKVVKYYPGNEWMPDQVTADIRSLLK
jgi:protein SCO1/2